MTIDPNEIKKQANELRKVYPVVNTILNLIEVALQHEQGAAADAAMTE